MSIIRDVPVGPPRVWTFAVTVTGLVDQAWWNVYGPAGMHAEWRGIGTHVTEIQLILQDVIRWEMVRQADGSDQLQVRHTRVRPPKVHDSDEYQEGYGISVVASHQMTQTHPGTGPELLVPPRPTVTAALTGYSADGHSVGHLDQPSSLILDGSSFTSEVGPFDELFASKEVMRISPTTPLLIDIEARRWPSGEPIVGLEVTVFPNKTVGAGPLFPFPLLTTDIDGNATLDTSSPPPGWPSVQLGTWAGATVPIIAHARTQALRTGALDYSQPYARSAQRGNDDAGYFELWRAPELVRFARASSYTLEAGTWTRAGNTLTRPLSAAQGQSMRQYRYLRIRLTASTASSSQIHLYTDWHNPDTGATDPPVSSRSLTTPVYIAQGENTFDLDLVAIDRWTGDQYGPKPFGAYGAFYGQTRGQINGNKTWNVALPDARKATDGGLWDHHNPDWLALTGLAPGADYVIQEVTAHDLAGTGRTPLRVLGSAMPGGGGEPISTFSGTGLSNIANATVRVLANGRPIAYAPNSFRDVSQDVYAFGPGSALVSGHVLTVQDLMDRWREYYDGGTGVWTLATDFPDMAALCPQVMMEPSSVTEAGFALDALACSPTLNVAPGFDVTVSPSVTLRLNLGGVVEGLLFDDTSRRGGQGKTVRSSIQNPPPGDALSPSGPVTELVTTADADGYFALGDLFQPAYWPNTHALQVQYDPNAFTRGYVLPYLTRHLLWADDDPPTPGKAQSSAGRPYVSPADPGDPWAVVVGHRNTVFFYDLAQFLRALAERDFAQDHATGRLLHVWSDDTTGTLTSEAREGWQGLAGAAVRAATPILDTSGHPRQGANPSVSVIAKTGQASLVYTQGDATGAIVRAVSDDHLLTLGAESMPLFSRAGGYPHHYQDASTGLTNVFCAFDNPDSTQDVLQTRLNALGAQIPWRDGTTQKTVAAGLVAAGRPVALPNRYDAVQSILLLHGDNKFTSPDGGETWVVVT